MSFISQASEGLDVYLARQNATQNTSSVGTLVSANCTTPVLDAGTVYMVMYRGNHGASATFANSQLSLFYGATEIAQSIAEGRGLSQPWDGGQCQGFTRVVGNGVDALSFQHMSLSGGQDCFSGAMMIIAQPLTGLTEGYDYFYAGNSDPTFEATGIGANWVTGVQADFDLPDPMQEWGMFFSAEGMISNGSTTDGFNFRFQEGLTTIGGQSYRQEWEDDSNVFCMAAMDSLIRSSGLTTFRTQAMNTGPGSNVSIRRSNFFLLKSNFFTSFQHIVDSTGVPLFTNTGYSAADEFLNGSYTPPVLAKCLIIGSNVAACDTTNSAVQQIVADNGTDSLVGNVDGGEYQNDNGFDGGSDLIPRLTMEIFEPTVLGPVDFAVQYRSPSGEDCSIGRNAANDGGYRSNIVMVSLSRIGLEVDDVAASSTADNVTLDPVDFPLTVNNVSAASTVEDVALGVVDFPLIVEDAVSPVTVDEIAMDPVNFVLSVANSTVVTTVDSVLVTPLFDVAPANASAPVTVPEFFLVPDLIPGDGQVIATAEGVAIFFEVFPSGTTSPTTIDSVVLFDLDFPLIVEDAEAPSTSPQPFLDPELLINDASGIVTADVVGLDVDLFADSAASVTTADGDIPLTQQNVLAPEDMRSHASSAEPPLSEAAFILVFGASAPTTAQGDVPLTQQNILVLDNVSSLTTAQGDVPLTQQNILVPNDAQAVSAWDLVALDPVNFPLQPADAGAVSTLEGDVLLYLGPLVDAQDVRVITTVDAPLIEGVVFDDGHTFFVQGADREFTVFMQRRENLINP